MNITLSIIAKKLNTLFPCKQNREELKDIPLRGVLFYCNEFTPHHLHIITAEEMLSMPACNEDIALLCLGKPSIIPSDCDCLYLPETTDFKMVYNAVEDICNRFYDWLNEIRFSHSSMDELQKILNLSLDYMKLEMLITNKNYDFLATTQGCKDLFGKEMGETKLNLNILNRLLGDDAFLEAEHHVKPFFYHNLDDKGKTLCFNIKIDDMYQARLLCFARNDLYLQGDIKLVECLGNVLTEVFHRDFKKNIQKRKRDVLNRILLDIIEGKSPNHKKISPILKEQGWTIQCKYRVIRHDVYNIAGRPEFSEEYYYSYLEETFYGSTVLKHKGKIIMVINLDQLNKDEDLFRSDMEHFLESVGSKAGISEDFSDISLLNFYERQADLALEIGKQKDKTSRQYLFSQYRFESIFTISSSNLMPEHLCNPMLFRLKDYDEKEGTELYRTLYCYIKNQFNATHTAKELYVHRTTLLIRLERIKKLCGMDSFDSWDLILDLMFSYRLLQNDESFKTKKENNFFQKNY